MDEDPRSMLTGLARTLRNPGYRPPGRRYLVDPADPELARLRAETEARNAAAVEAAGPFHAARRRGPIEVTET